MARGSKDEAEFRGRMRNAGYDEWEIDEEIAQMIDVQRINERCMRSYRETGTFAPALEHLVEEGLIHMDPRSANDMPAMASSLEAYEDNAGNIHLFALDGDEHVLGTVCLPPTQRADAMEAFGCLKSDPTFWRAWDALETLHYDAQRDLDACRESTAEGNGGCKLIEEHAIEGIGIPARPSLREAGKGAQAASKAQAPSAHAVSMTAKEVR